MNRKAIKRTISIIVALCCLLVSTTVSNAAGTYNPGSNAVVAGGYFSAGSPVFMSSSSTVALNDGMYDVYLRTFQFDGMGVNARPAYKHVYISAYTMNHSHQAGSQAGFTTGYTGYSYSYKSGYGGAGNQYCLRAHSDCTTKGCLVDVRWEA